MVEVGIGERIGDNGENDGIDVDKEFLLVVVRRDGRCVIVDSDGISEII